MYDDQARLKLLEGASKLAAAVKATLGPAGRTVILEKSFGGPKVTKDGVTVAKEVELEDVFENMGAKLLNEVSTKTSDAVGDGTTTATVLAEAAYREGLRVVALGANAVIVKRGMDKAAKVVCDHLVGLSKSVKNKEQIAQVGALSANNDPAIGNLLADAMEKVGKDGVITVEDGKGIETTIELVDGMQFDKGFQSPYFMTKAETLEAELEDPLILIHEKKISSLAEIVPLLEKVAQIGRSLLVISEEVEGEVLAALVLNKLRGVLKVAAVKAPGFGDRRTAMLEDLAILTGGRFVSEDLGIKLESLEIGDLGGAKQVLIDKDNTTVIGGKGKKADVQARISQIKSQIEETTSDYDREKLEERLAKLAGGVAMIHVGAATEQEMTEKKARVEDALHATRAAVEEGIVPGGGVALLRAIPLVEEAGKKMKGDEKLGARILARVLEAPLREISANAGLDGSVVVAEVKEKAQDVGLNARTGEYVNLWKAGVVDPTKVTRSALQNAVSVAGVMLTTETLLADLDKQENTVSGAVV